MFSNNICTCVSRKFSITTFIKKESYLYCKSSLMETTFRNNCLFYCTNTVLIMRTVYSR